MTGLSTNQIPGLPHLHIQDGAMMKKGCDVMSGSPNKARPEVKFQKIFLLTTIPRLFLQHDSVSVRKRFESLRVYDAFVKDKSVAFRSCDDTKMFGGGVSPEEILVDDVDVASFLERSGDFIEEILSHDVIVELPGATDIEGEAPDLAAHFTTLSSVPVILGASGREVDDEVAIVEFVGHFFEVISERDVGLSREGGVDDRIGVKVEDALLETIQVTV